MAEDTKATAAETPKPAPGPAGPAASPAPQSNAPASGQSQAASSEEQQATSTSADNIGDKAQAQQASNRVTVDHGEEPEYVKREREAREEALKDPYGTTPVQMRQENLEDAPEGRTVAVSGISPHLQEFPEGQEVTGGTLPPV